MTARKNNRGSAMLMVVGLLVILALLGASLLVVVYMDRQQTRSMIARNPADYTGDAVASQLAQLLRDGMKAGASARYSDSNWIQFVDSLANDSNAYWMTPFFFATDLGDPVGGWGVYLADTDGDGVAESYLLPMGIHNSFGDSYYAAVKLTDLSGLVDLSTAGTKDPNIHALPRNGSAIDLPSLLGQALYVSVHVARAGGASLRAYDSACGQRPLQPTDPNSYLAFGIGEEVWLRWKGLKPVSTQCGRLYPVLNTLPTVRPSVTSYSVSTVASRRPDANYNLSARMAVDPNLTTTDSARQAMYARMVAMVQKLGLGAGNVNFQKRMAASFVANLWAYQSATDSSFKFRPTSETFDCFGLAQRLVITEGYAAHRGDTVGGTTPANDWVCASAIEVYNPTSSAVAWDYKIVSTTDPNLVFTPTAAPASIPAGGRVVFWDMAKGSGAGADDKNILNIAGLNDSYRTPGLSFVGNQGYRLIRTVGGDDIPVDQVTAGDLGYPLASTADLLTVDIGKVNSWDAHRDDDPARARYNIAAYEHVNGALAHTLNAVNFSSYPASTPSIDTVAANGAPILRSQMPVIDLAELNLIYFSGPMKDGSTLICFPTTMANYAALGDLVTPPARTRGRLDVAPPTLVTYGGYAPGTYPDVPAGCLWSEFFTMIPPDTSRDAVTTRVYGRLNVNTAPREALLCLPFPAAIRDPLSGASRAVDPNVAVDYIMAYRDMRGTLDTYHNYAARDSNLAGGGSAVPGLRTTVSGNNSRVRCFLTPDEVAIPLADYANALFGWTNYTSPSPTVGGLYLTQHKDYAACRDSIWRPLSNVITVNTDVVAANIYVQMGNPAKYWWRYIAVIDRSNCVTYSDTPAIILFAEVR